MTSGERTGETMAPWYISRRYAALWSGALLSAIGDMIFEFTLIVWVAARFGDEGAWRVAAVFVASLIPIIIVGPIAGTLVDQWRDKVRIVVRSSVLIAVLTALLVPFLTDGSLGFAVGDTVQTVVLLTIVFVISAINQFIRPANGIISRDIVPVEERARAASLQQVAMGTAILIGPPLAAPLFVSFGLTWALALNAASFVGAAALTRFATRGLTLAGPDARAETVPGMLAATPPGVTLPTPVAVPFDARVREVGADLVAGLRMFRRSPTLMTVLVCLVIALAGFGLLNAVDIYFVINNLGGSETIYGWFGTAQGAGTLLGAVLVSLIASRVAPPALLWSGLLAIGIVTIVYSRMASVEAGLVLIFLFGLCFPAVNIAMSPLTLRVTPRAYLGRVSGTINPVINVAQLVGVLVGGLAYGAIGPEPSRSVGGVSIGALDGLLALTGVACVVAAAFAWLRFRSPAVRAEMEAGVGAEDQMDGTRSEAT